MRSLAHPRQRPQTAISSGFARPTWAPSGLPIRDAQRPPGNQAGVIAATSAGRSHDFSHIPIHSPTPAAIQTKRVISEPGDADEQEADRQANQVMRASGPSATDAGGQAPAGPHSGAAMALEPADRQFFETRFHHNFADVRIYAGREANASARRLHMLMFAITSSWLTRGGMAENPMRHVRVGSPGAGNGGFGVADGITVTSQPRSAR